MSTGRTLIKHARLYLSGYDMSGYTRDAGALMWEYEEANATGMSNSVMGYLPNKPTITPSVVNGLFDNTETSGMHTVLGTPGSSRVFMMPFGIRAAPAEGDPTFCGQFQQASYMTEGDIAVNVTMNFDEWDGAALIKYHNPWGILLHAASAETAANSASAEYDHGAQTTQGGYMVYQVLAGNGTATILVEHADTNVDGSFAALTGATTGVIDCSSPTSGIVACATTETVERFLRWQLTLGTATTVTFALAFVREYRNFT